MELPLGMRIARDFYRSQKWQRKSMCSVFIKGNKMIASFNSRKTHTISMKHGDPFHRTHAEMAVLKQLRDCEGGYLYVYRERGDTMEPAKSRPCKACMKFIVSKKIKSICYFTDDGIAWEKIF
jgi:deoxycytidylate deaminase